MNCLITDPTSNLREMELRERRHSLYLHYFQDKNLSELARKHSSKSITPDVIKSFKAICKAHWSDYLWFITASTTTSGPIHWLHSNRPKQKYTGQEEPYKGTQLCCHLLVSTAFRDSHTTQCHCLLRWQRNHNQASSRESLSQPSYPHTNSNPLQKDTKPIGYLAALGKVVV